MDAITTTARQRAVMATVADLIVAVAAGRTLRVAIGCSRRDETAFADQLTEALRVRGRPGHCRTTNPEPVTAGGDASLPSCSDDPTVAVITSATTDADETEVVRINIQVRTSNRTVPPAATAQPGADGLHRGSLADQEPDIIVDYLEPGGAAIRHLGPTFAAPASPPGSQSDRRLRLP